MTKRSALHRTKAFGEARRRWRHARTLAFVGFCLPAFAGADELAPGRVPEARVTGTTTAAHVWLEEPTDYERREVKGFSLEAPKGWLCSESPGVVTFGGQVAGIRVRTVALRAHPENLDALGVAGAEVKSLGGAKPARLRRMKEVDLPAGRAVLLKFRSNPGPAIDAPPSLECSVYIFLQPRQLQILSVWSPTASDHRALRQRVAESLRWK
ncbi:MAG TPA: hypothetical protein VGD78_02280 [Chthoniobacterales bacterium]